MMLLPIRTSLKRAAHLGALALLLTATSACPEDDDKETPNGQEPGDESDAGIGGGGDTNLTGSYTVDGVRHSCKVTTQVFVTREYSVVCQNDDDGLVQITFKDEASARLTQTLRLVEMDIFEHPDADTIAVNYIPFDDRVSTSSSEDTVGSASAKASGSRNEVTLTDVVLDSNISTTTAKVSATVPF